MLDMIVDFLRSTGFSDLFIPDTPLFGIMVPGKLIMVGIACLLLYMGIKKGFEPYLLLPIAFGMLLVNLPLAGLMDSPLGNQPGGLRVVQKEGQKYNPSNFLFMHAMGPNVAGVIGSAVVAGLLLNFFG